MSFHDEQSSVECPCCANEAQLSLSESGEQVGEMSIFCGHCGFAAAKDLRNCPRKIRGAMVTFVPDFTFEAMLYLEKFSGINPARLFKVSYVADGEPEYPVRLLLAN